MVKYVGSRAPGDKFYAVTKDDGSETKSTGRARSTTQTAQNTVEISSTGLRRAMGSLLMKVEINYFGLRDLGLISTLVQR